MTLQKMLCLGCGREKSELSASISFCSMACERKTKSEVDFLFILREPAAIAPDQAAIATSGVQRKLCFNTDTEPETTAVSFPVRIVSRQEVAEWCLQHVGVTAINPDRLWELLVFGFVIPP